MDGETIGNLVGYPILGAALILLWRLYLEVRRDRDYWRDKALDRLHATNAVLDDTERLMQPLKIVERAVKHDAGTLTPLTTEERLSQVVELLLHQTKNAEEEGR